MVALADPGDKANRRRIQPSGLNCLVSVAKIHTSLVRLYPQRGLWAPASRPIAATAATREHVSGRRDDALLARRKQATTLFSGCN